MIMPISLTQKEKRNGCVWMAVSLLLLPSLISLGAAALGATLSDANIFYYFLNFTFTLVIFRKFLLGNLLVALDRVFSVLWYGILAYLGQQTIGEMLNILIYSLFPDFVNLNDASVGLMVRQSPLLAICVMTLVPVAEETLHRGLIFRGLYDRNPTLAYIASVVIFAAIHVAGYIGSLTPAQLLISFLQYLPAGYCLCFAYRRSGTLICPILVHMLVNAISVLSLVR